MAEENEQVYGVDIYLHKIRGWVTSRGFTPHGLAKAASFGPGTLQICTHLNGTHEYPH